MIEREKTNRTASRVHLALLTGCAWLFISIASKAEPASHESANALLDEARTALAQGKLEDALALAAQAIELMPDDAGGYLLRGDVRVARQEPTEAIVDYTRALAIDPEAAEVFDRRGSERFKAGDFVGAIADFDRYLQLRPEQEKSHWRRGIAYYYAGEYRLGAEQFAAYQTFDDNDVENAVWRYLCMARHLGAETARREMLRIRQDRRVPMMVVYALYSGRAAPDDVMQAVDDAKLAESPRRMALFYAHLYLGLWHESEGDAALAGQHLALAAGEYVIDHYMGDVARVHARLLKPPAERERP